MLLQRAPICTMDAFCLDLLHKHFQALDIPPDFAPADPGSVELLRTAALAETLEHAYADPDFCAFADLYGKGRTDKPGCFTSMFPPRSNAFSESSAAAVR